MHLICNNKTEQNKIKGQGDLSQILPGPSLNQLSISHFRVYKLAFFLSCHSWPSGKGESRGRSPYCQTSTVCPGLVPRTNFLTHRHPPPANPPELTYLADRSAMFMTTLFRTPKNTCPGSSGVWSTLPIGVEINSKRLRLTLSYPENAQTQPIATSPSSFTKWNRD